MAKLVFETALKIDPDTGEVYSYWDHWPLAALAKEARSMGTAMFAAAYQNDPSGLEGNVLKTAWLHYYLPEDLQSLRDENGGYRGPRHVGVDPTFGGEGDNPDDMAMVVIEMIGNKGFLVDYYYGKQPLTNQAQHIENALNMYQPSFTIVEDMATKGYVYTALTSQVNNGMGTRHAITIETPQSHSGGGKRMRFLSMAPRFEQAQLRVPGIRDGNQLVVHPDWQAFQDQWGSFPTGHDDILDATFWAQYSSFRIAPAGAASKTPDGHVTSDTPTSDEEMQSERIARRVDRTNNPPKLDRQGRPQRTIGEQRRRLQRRKSRLTR